MYAFERAATLGVDVLEMDIHATSDGKMIVIHDDTVDRTTNGTGYVRDLTFQEISALDAGYKWTSDGVNHPFRGKGITIPTLQEVLHTFPKMLLNIEVKEPTKSTAEDVCTLLRESKMDTQALVVSKDEQFIESFRKHCEAVATGAVESEVRIFWILTTLHLDAIYRPKATAFQVPEYSGELKIVSPRFIDSAHGYNQAVHVWTVNELSAMQRLIDLQVDGIMTDFPDQLLQVLGRISEHSPQV